MGISEKCKNTLPHHRSNNFRERDSKSDRAGVPGLVGQHVDHDEKGEAGQEALQENEVPTIR